MTARRRFAPDLDCISSAQESSAAHMRRRVRSRSRRSRAQAQTTIRFHPAFRQAASFRRSRRTFRDHFSIQNAMLLFGMVESAQPWRCQKQPRMSMIVRARATTMSGRPVNRLSQTRKRHPAAKIRCRTSFSGFVSLPRIRLMSALRCSWVILSMQCGVFYHKFSPAACHARKMDELQHFRIVILSCGCYSVASMGQVFLRKTI